MYKDTVTIFNRFKNKSGDAWYPSVLHNVNINLDKATINEKYGEKSQDNVILNVQFTPDSSDKKIGTKIWKPPKEWEKQDLDLLPQAITFTPGQNFDFFYLGEWGNETPISDNDYTDGFYNYMNSKHDYVFAITSASCYSVIPHFEITGK